MVDTAATGKRLEQEIAAFFRANGYEARCNEVLEGRSGGRHEVDVLAETSDALTSYRVAVECKAWQQPIEKDVVSKLDYVRRDLGLHKGIVVSLAGWRAGAALAAGELGIELWGPAELRRHLGDGAVTALSVPGRDAAGAELGYPFTADAADAERRLRWAGLGRLQLRTVERLRWSTPVWLPAHLVRLTVARQESGRFRARLRSTTVDHLYEAVGGTFAGEAPDPPEPVRLDLVPLLRPVWRDTKVHARLRRAVDDFQRVSSPAAVERHADTLEELGLPVPCAALSIDATTLVHLPVHVGLLESRHGRRLVAVDGRTGQPADDLARVLTADLAQVREQLEPVA